LEGLEDGKDKNIPCVHSRGRKVMRYLQIEERLADGYICPWRNSECLGMNCMCWYPSEDLDGFGRCGLVPGEED